MSVAGRPKAIEGTGGMVACRTVTPEYFRVLDLHMLAGRRFTEADRTPEQHLMIVSKLLANVLFLGDDPIGQRVQLHSDSPFYTVVGVAANVKNAGLTGTDEPEYYRLRTNGAEDWGSTAVLLLDLENAESSKTLFSWIRTQIASIDPTVPVDIETLTERVNKLADAPRFEAALVSLFAATGLLMAIIGLYGVIAYVASQRTQEIGVRMALGATRLNILRLIAAEGMRMVTLGGLLGLGAALALSRVMQSLLFQVSPRDPGTYIAVAILLALVALAATLLPARSAMRVDPVEALRRE